MKHLNLLLKEVPGVIAPIDLKFTNLVGTVDGFQYSLTPYNITQNIKNNIKSKNISNNSLRIFLSI